MSTIFQAMLSYIQFVNQYTENETPLDKEAQDDVIYEVTNRLLDFFNLKNRISMIVFLFHCWNVCDNLWNGCFVKDRTSFGVADEDAIQSIQGNV